MCGCRIFFLCWLLSRVETWDLCWTKGDGALWPASCFGELQGRGITACQLRVKYFSTTTPLFFTSGSTDVSLVPWPFTFRACWVKKKDVESHTKKGYRVKERKRKYFFALYSICDLHGEVCQWIPCLHLRGSISRLEFEGWSRRFSVLTLVLCPPSTALPWPPPTRFQGLGQRLVVLSPSAAETWYRESPSKLLFYSTESGQAVYILYLLFSHSPLFALRNRKFKKWISSCHYDVERKATNRFSTVNISYCVE